MKFTRHHESGWTESWTATQRDGSVVVTNDKDRSEIDLGPRCEFEPAAIASAAYGLYEMDLRPEVQS